jgi:hypothetical protein
MSVNQMPCHFNLPDKKSCKTKTIRHFDVYYLEVFLLIFDIFATTY